MRTLKFLLQKEFRQIFRDKGILAVIFVMPTIQLLILPWAADYEIKMTENGTSIDPALLKLKWEEKVKTVFEEATLAFSADIKIQTGGKIGEHSEHLGKILADLQMLQRTYPGCEW